MLKHREPVHILTFAIDLAVPEFHDIADANLNLRSLQRVPMETAEEVLRLYRETYFDLNMRHFHEKLRDEHQIELSYRWVQQALQGAGLVAKGKRNSFCSRGRLQ